MWRGVVWCGDGLASAAESDGIDSRLEVDLRDLTAEDGVWWELIGGYVGGCTCGPVGVWVCRWRWVGELWFGGVRVGETR